MNDVNEECAYVYCNFMLDFYYEIYLQPFTIQCWIKFFDTLPFRLPIFCPFTFFQAPFEHFLCPFGPFLWRPVHCHFNLLILFTIFITLVTFLILHSVSYISSLCWVYSFPLIFWYIGLRKIWRSMSKMVFIRTNAPHPNFTNNIQVQSK